MRLLPKIKTAYTSAVEKVRLEELSKSGPDFVAGCGPGFQKWTDQVYAPYNNYAIRATAITAPKELLPKIIFSLTYRLESS
ncbi:hypothetical protein HY212_06235 [Candidatus Pacearchaeota archaeon]|nr:hypothetical protein [Candidatus Pacearchaeota archaeon]